MGTGIRESEASAGFLSVRRLVRRFTPPRGFRAFTTWGVFGKGRAMPGQKKSIPVAPWKLGDRVKLKGREGIVGRIIEFRGPLGPDGTAIYGIEIQNKPVVSYIELREDQIEHAPAPVRIRGIKSPKFSPRRPKADKRAKAR
jgi:hypothetical protein